MSGIGKTWQFKKCLQHRWLARAGVLAMLVSGSPAMAEEPWQAVLRLQLGTEKKCELALIISVRQIPIEGLDALEGRVRCSDTREFDFSRPRPHMKFNLQLCQPTVC